jgi:hypothetical protein
MRPSSIALWLSLSSLCGVTGCTTTPQPAVEDTASPDQNPDSEELGGGDPWNPTSIYSVGARMGQLNKFSVKGWVYKSGEGELLMGRDSTEWYTSDSNGNKTYKNPWSFSTNPDNEKTFQSFQGKYVVIRYNQAQWPNVKRDTDYIATEIVSVDATKNPADCSNPNATGTYSSGSRIGRIVKASYKGTINKSYEFIMQVGNAGGEFFEFSATDENMYKCAVEWMESGKRVNLGYKQAQFYDITKRDTGYDIASLSAVADL